MLCGSSADPLGYTRTRTPDSVAYMEWDLQIYSLIIPTSNQGSLIFRYVTIKRVSMLLSLKCMPKNGILTLSPPPPPLLSVSSWQVLRVVLYSAG